MLTLLLEATLKGSLLLALAAALTSLMRGRSAAARHLVWGIALLLAATLPPGSVTGAPKSLLSRSSQN